MDGLFEDETFELPPELSAGLLRTVVRVVHAKGCAPTELRALVKVNVLSLVVPGSKSAMIWGNRGAQ